MARSFSARHGLMLLLILALPLLAGAENSQSSTELAAVLQVEINNRFSTAEPGAAVIVAKDGRIVLRTGLGMANLELGVPIRPEMIFRIGSVSKQFTAVSILMLMENGKLSLDDEITRFLPDYPTQGRKITIEHLLTHTSGVLSYTDMPEFWQQQRKDMTLPELIDFFKNKPMDFSPGESWHYSNSGYVLLGAVIEKVSGQSYADFVEQHIFAPLGMTHSSFDQTPKVITGRIPGYKKSAGEFVNADYMSMSLPFAAGSLLSSVDDLAKWDAALYTDALVSQNSLHRAWTTYTLDDGRPTNYGYGWMVSRVEGIRMVAHRGGINGFSGMTARVPDTHVFVAVLTNREGGEANLALKLAVLASGRQWHDPVAVAVPIDALEPLIGDYRLGKKNMVGVTRVDKSLFAELPPYGKLALTPSSASEFFVTADPLARLTFRRSASGAIESVLIHTGRGPDDVATRIIKPLTPVSSPVRENAP